MKEPGGGAARGPLHGLRVLDMTDARTQFCGKLLSDLGADVILVEPPEGSEGRRLAPFAGDAQDIEGSLYFWHCNAGKRSVTLDVRQPRGASLLRERIAPEADVLIESYDPGYLDGLGVGYADLAATNPGLIFASITPFGQTGPYKRYKASELVQSALGGIAYLCGYDDDDRCAAGRSQQRTCVASGGATRGSGSPRRLVQPAPHRQGGVPGHLHP